MKLGSDERSHPDLAFACMDDAIRRAAATAAANDSAIRISAASMMRLSDMWAYPSTTVHEEIHLRRKALELSEKTLLCQSSRFNHGRSIQAKAPPLSSVLSFSLQHCCQNAAS